MPLAAAPVLGAIIGGGASLGSSLIGSHAAGEASSDYSNEIQQAMNRINASEGRATSLYNPYVGLGADSVKALQSSGFFGPATYNTTGELAPNSLGEQWDTQFKAPTAQDVAATPGYQFARDAGLNAIQGSAAAQGNLLSGGTMKGLESYGTGLANQYYQQAYNNALGQYMNNYNIFQSNQQNTYNRLMGTTGLGLSATGAAAGVQMAGAQDIANLLTGKGTTQANADLASGNALSNGLTNAGFAAQLALMNKNKQASTTGSGYAPLTTLPTDTLPSYDNLMPGA